MSTKKDETQSTNAEAFPVDAKRLKEIEKAKRRAEHEARLAAQRTQNTNENKSQKSKAELKAERRAQQEAQRAAKTAKETETPKASNESKIINTKTAEETSKTTISKTDIRTTSTSSTKNSGNNSVDSLTNDMSKASLSLHKSNHSQSTTSKDAAKKVPVSSKSTRKGQMFSHIPKRCEEIEQLTEDLTLGNSYFHPIIIQVGLKMNKGLIRGSNARCVAMLIAFKKVIRDYVTPPQKELARDLEGIIDEYVKFLSKCRPLAIGMSNAVKFVKFNFTKLQADQSAQKGKRKDSDAKHSLIESIDNFIRDEIIYAQRGIAENALTKIRDNGDVILTFGCSHIVKHVLHAAAKRGKKFRVIVIDSRPRFNGREMAKFLLKNDIEVSYILINAVSYVMKEVTKVLLGAHSLLANGYVMSVIGSSQISLVAHSHNVPVLFCCEFYKFSERVHTDSFVYNEIGKPEDFLKGLAKKDELETALNTIPTLSILNLGYDITPPEFVSVVITEKGILPCTSAPAVLRVRETK